MFECIRFTSYNHGTLRGFADIFVPKWGVEISGFTLYEKEGKRWVNAPSKEYQDKDGSTKYKPVFFFKEKDLWEKFMINVKEAIDVKIKEQTENI